MKNPLFVFITSITLFLSSGCADRSLAKTALDSLSEAAEAAEAAQIQNKDSYFKVLTYNTWLLKIKNFDLSRHTQERLEKIPQALYQTGAHLIALQEVWDPQVRSYLIDEMKKKSNGNYQYHRFLNYDREKKTKGHYGVFASNGLLLISQYPIKKTNLDSQLAFSQYTRKDEAFVTKGAIHIEVNVPQIGTIDVYNTHLGALTVNKDKKQEYSYIADELAAHKNQMGELFNFIEKTNLHKTTLLIGDFNMDPFLMTKSGLDQNKKSKLSELSEKNGFKNTLLDFNQTNFRKKFSWSNKNPFIYTGALPHSPDETIDHIYLRDKKDCLVVHDAQIILDEKVELNKAKEKLPLSDHYGVMTTFENNCENN